MLIVYTLTVLVSAALLFVVQPMFARMVLPLLGGSPAVWNTALVWFQLALLGGYAYVHGTTAWLGARRQAILHLALMLVAAACLPIVTTRAGVPPTDRNPIPWLLGLMTLALGAPFLAVSATGPLMQKWLAATRHRLAPDPYFLYAASNLGSMVGLLSYPTLVEPHLRLAVQTHAWAVGYGVLVALTAIAAALMWRSPAAARGGAGASDVAPGTTPTSIAAPPAPPLNVRRRLRWVLLALAPSSLMMAVTTHLTSEIAAMPLLWVVPLAIYLASFILVFARRPLIPHAVMVRALPLLVLPLVMALMAHLAEPVFPVMGFHVLVLFVAAMVCHGELARDRPDPAHLTEFYLWLAVGGALGGVFNALIAPRVFTSVVEYPIAIVLVCLLAPARRADAATPRARILDVALPAAVLAVALLVVGTLRARGIPITGPAIVLLLAVLIFPIYGFSRRPVRFALGVGALMVLNPADLVRNGRVLHAERSFFGIHRVLLDATGTLHQLYHGATLHGIQRVRPLECREPLSYYGRSGPLGDIFRAARARPVGRAIGIAGLGAGSIASYAEPTDAWTYFEIDPAVERIASDPTYFCFLSAAPVRPRIVLGDARLSLGATPQRFDLLILDAYTSDAIPIHLLTREALRLYVGRLAPGGMLAFHLSNRYFDLAPVVARLATDAGLACRLRDSGDPGAAAIAAGFASSSYAVLARRDADLGALAADPRWHAPARADRTPVWTDDFSSLFSVLRHP